MGKGAQHVVHSAATAVLGHALEAKLSGALSVPKPQMPQMPGLPTQAQSAVDTVGGTNMTLSQQMAMSAGGTIFGPVNQGAWWRQSITNQSGGGHALLGA